MGSNCFYSLKAVDICQATGAEIYSSDTFVVNVNGSIIGLTRFPNRFVHNFRRLRRARRFSEFVSIYINHHHRAVYIASDGGRICRPMIIVENMRPKVTNDHVLVSRCSRRFTLTFAYLTLTRN